MPEAALSAYPKAVFDDDDATYAKADETRTLALKAVQKELRQAGVDGSRDTFSRAFANAMHVLELNDLDVAQAFQISRPTVGRWIRGEAAPHAVGRKPILEALARRVATKLKHIGKR